MSTEVLSLLAVVATFINALALISVHRGNRIHSVLEGKFNRDHGKAENILNRQHEETENTLNRLHSETIAAINHSYSKEKHAANHLYTLKACHLENAGKIIGEIQFWAEKSISRRTRTEFGTDIEAASHMSKAFEDLSLYTMQYFFAFKEIVHLQKYMSKLTSSVNYIENMVHSNEYNSESENWKSAVVIFHEGLSPLTYALQEEIGKLMQKN
ncbi:hypothetical protein BTJ40_12815 [Microbulbifer sp. A4B17]|uniref:hypothetical protein n=1 Tax=Microbulbifer sp. A4B17 TaxID=359370 RepID=UPI000D52B22F|nr:hypothetical protein [Microbulbifer sp. A4B17]AWF81636.1 hypothetical protein BTJ40_12815 [Microbulbifer sp. A4B17]